VKDVDLDGDRGRDRQRHQRREAAAKPLARRASMVALHWNILPVVAPGWR